MTKKSPIDYDKMKELLEPYRPLFSKSVLSRGTSGGEICEISFLKAKEMDWKTFTAEEAQDHDRLGLQALDELAEIFNTEVFHRADGYSEISFPFDLDISKYPPREYVEKPLLLKPKVMKEDETYLVFTGEVQGRIRHMSQATDEKVEIWAPSEEKAQEMIREIFDLVDSVDIRLK